MLLGIAVSGDEAGVLRAVGELDRAVMADEQRMRHLADGRPAGSRLSTDREQQLMLSGRDPGASCLVPAPAQERAQRVAQLGQAHVVAIREIDERIFRRLVAVHGCIVSFYDIVKRYQQEIMSLLDEDPDLGAGLSQAERALAERRAIATVVALDRPKWDTTHLNGASMVGWLGLYVTEGMLLRRVGIGPRSACELFGPGDLIRPWDADAVYTPLPVSVDWRVLSKTRMAVLDASFGRRIARWPQLSGAITGRVAQRARMLALMAAVTRLPRAYERLLILFWLLSERWGTVTPAGVQLILPVTHEVLGTLIGTQRPTVTIALARLARAGLLHRRGRDRWLLTSEAIDRLDSPESVDLGDEAGLPDCLALAASVGV
jgi:CRP/FNR family transcriptional regulator, cyclic AMP receptor protein